jgi:hypothetical protein
MYGLIMPNFGSRIVRGKMRRRMNGNFRPFQKALFMSKSPLIPSA